MNSGTNEQSVAAAIQHLDLLKQAYLASIAIVLNGAGSPKGSDVMACHQEATRFFSYAENFVGTSDLLGAHRSGQWLTGFAETCCALLDSYLDHVDMLEAYAHVVSPPRSSPHAYANMQRMVKKYFPEDAIELRRRFVSRGLPVTGFDMSALGDEMKVWERLLCVGIGLLLVIGSYFMAIEVPNPSPWQEFVSRVALAIGASALITIVPGFVNGRLQAKGLGQQMSISAGGAVVIFILLWFYNPERVGGTSISSLSSVAVDGLSGS